MNQTETLLNCVAKNAQTGAIAIEQLIPKTEDAELRSELNSQHEQYVSAHRNAENLLHSFGFEAKETPVMAKAGMWMGTQMNTAFDRSNAHLADIMIQGLTMGVIDTTKARNECPDADGQAQGMASSFITQQQDSIERMKQFLT